MDPVRVRPKESDLSPGGRRKKNAQLHWAEISAESPYKQAVNGRRKRKRGGGGSRSPKKRAEVWMQNLMLAMKQSVPPEKKVARSDYTQHFSKRDASDPYIMSKRQTLPPPRILRPSIRLHMVNAFNLPVDEILDWKEEVDDIIKNTEEKLVERPSSPATLQSTKLPNIRLKSRPTALASGIPSGAQEQIEKKGVQRMRKRKAKGSDPLPELVDTIVSHGAAPKFYGVKRQAVPVRIPEGVKALHKYFEDFPDELIKSTIPPDFAQRLGEDGKQAKLPSNANLMIHDKTYGVSAPLKLRRQASKYLLNGIPIAKSSAVAGVETIEVSTEMQEQLNAVLATTTGEGFWQDEVNSTIARPLLADSFVPNANTSTNSTLRPGTAPAFQEQDAHSRHYARGFEKGLKIASIAQGRPSSSQGRNSAEVSQAFSASRRSKHYFPYSQEAHEAAAIVQRAYRRRRNWLHSVCLTMQKFFRMALARVRVLEKKYTMVAAAIVIQTVARSFVVRKRIQRYLFLERSGYMVIAQCVVRVWLSRRKVRAMKYARDFFAASQIQRVLARGRQGRRRFRKIRRQMRKRKSTQIQAFWRGFSARKKYFKELALVKFGAAKIQARFRGQQWRRKLLLRNSAANYLRRMLRGYIGRMRARHRRFLYNNAEVMQALIRGHVWKKRMVDLRASRIKAEENRLLIENGIMTTSSAEALKTTLRMFKNREGKQMVRTEIAKVKAASRKQQIVVRTMSKQERENFNLKDTFSAYDLDGTNVLEINELKRLCVALSVPMSSSRLKAALRSMDKDGSGTVDLEEFCVWYRGDDRNDASYSALIRTVLRMKLKAARFLRSLTGSYYSRRARREICARRCTKARRKAMQDFRETEPYDYWYHFHVVPTKRKPKGVPLEQCVYYDEKVTQS